MTQGYSHIGMSTHDMDATIAFYTRILGFARVADQVTLIREGGQIRQVYFDLGRDEYLVFMEARDIASIPQDYPTGINSALGTPAGMYHLAFKVDTLEALQAKRSELLRAGVDVSDCIDLGHAQSIFLADPNDLQIEFCWHSRPFRPEDLDRKETASIAV